MKDEMKIEMPKSNRWAAFDDDEFRLICGGMAKTRFSGDAFAPEVDAKLEAMGAELYAEGTRRNLSAKGAIADTTIVIEVVFAEEEDSDHDK